ncbi:MAG: nucleoid-associated protein [Butyribacter sp.]|nr:nucleoid-associated protein [bacterium]MDY3853494.1 nucleoid-associated protein [Butyribacter sp.]
MQQDEIIIRKGIVHIMDGTLGYPVYSEEELELSPDINDFFRNHIYRLLSGDDLKKCVFSEEESEVYELVKQFDEADLVEQSKKIAAILYQIMNANVAIPSGDLAVITFQCQAKQYLALLKMNYKESYVHMTQNQDAKNVNQIICYQSTLPAGGTKLSEAVFINLEDYSVQIVEKKYEVNGSKVNYLSELFLKCHASMSSKSKLSIVTKAVEQVNKKHYAEEPLKQMEAKRIMKKEIETNGVLDVEKISEEIYGNAPEIKEEFDAKMEKYHMEKAQVTPKSEKTTKKFEKQYLKTDTGIEINIPMEQYQDADQVEFITNVDGTISVLIKNINKISTR